MYILGINAYHGDSSACIIKDGEIIAATEEERFTRIKHWAGFPELSIKFCLKEANIEVTQLDGIAISRDPSANIHKKIMHAAKKMVSIKSLKDRLSNSLKVGNAKEQLADCFGVNVKDIKAKLYQVEHHRSHLASAYFPSPFPEAALLSIDGFGDFTSTMTGIGKDGQITVFDSVIYPHSIGIFYTGLTQYLGFPNYGDEYKVMGLAPYGEPKYCDELKKVIFPTSDGLFKLETKYFKHAKEGVSMSWEGGEPHIDPIFSPELENLLGTARKKGEPLEQKHKDLATSVQKVTEDIIFHLMNSLHAKTGLDSICVAGGVAQNSVANGKITRNTPFKNVYVPSAGHDAGTAAGAAMYVYHQILKQPRVAPIWHAYTGSKFSDEEIKEVLAQNNISYLELTDEELYEKVTNRLIDSGVVGWFQGRAEFGPRALGNRSILADPRRTDAKDLLNEKIKRRESFRPFAPSILAEYVEEYFEVNDKVPFMEKVFPIKEEKHSVIPAVTHVDGTGRLQSVDKEFSPRYHALISAFKAKTGVPVLLNTSFNENEPIVNNPQEALNCFLRTKMDMLVMGNIVVER
ncbi:carbamoyltransferase [Fulvivirgaceae bacterium LMO-SS25]|tara:strand:- start:117 stop:1841 length:1725 start_codon:yes stop_codon:yes gene_type:complete